MDLNEYYIRNEQIHNMVCSLDKKETSLNYMLSRKDKIYLTNVCHNFEVIKYCFKPHCFKVRFSYASLFSRYSFFKQQPKKVKISRSKVSCLPANNNIELWKMPSVSYYDSPQQRKGRIMLLN